MPFPLGASAPLVTTIVDPDGIPTNPTTITLTVTRPDGTVDILTPTNTQAGTYAADYVPATAGLYSVRWLTTGPALALTDVIDVRPAAPGLIVSLADAKRKCKIPQDVTEHDDALRGYIETVTVAVEDHLHEAIVRRTVTEDIWVDWADEVPLGTTPVISLTSVATVDGATSWSVADLHVDSNSGVVTGLPYVRPFNGMVRFVYSAGRMVIPPNYSTAALIIIEHLWQQTERPQVRNGAPFAGGGYEDSMNTSYAGTMGFAIPNRALEILGKPPVMGG
jgi:hypothetical protein